MTKFPQKNIGMKFLISLRFSKTSHDVENFLYIDLNKSLLVGFEQETSRIITNACTCNKE